VTDERVTFATLGDCRSYWVTPGSATQITVDDSWAEMQIAAGAMSLVDAYAYPIAQVITRWVANDADPSWRPTMVDFAVPGPGRLLLVSDGLWNYTIEPSQLVVAIGEEPLERLALARRLVTFRQRVRWLRQHHRRGDRPLPARSSPGGRPPGHQRPERLARTMNFSASTYQNEFLPADATEVHAVVTVTASDAGDGTGPTTTSPDKAVFLIVDTSGSMGQPGTKIRAARQSVAASVEELPDGTWFAVTAENHEAFCVYPPASATGEPPSLVGADAMTRAEAANVARQLQPEGGTAIGTWLDLALDVLVGHPEAIKLAYLLTDGRNESEPHENLEAAL
jgi:hypothetical protein